MSVVDLVWMITRFFIFWVIILSKKYSNEDIEFLKKYYSIGDWDSIFLRFPTATKCSIHCAANRNGIKCNVKTSKQTRSENLKSNRWTDAELDILRKYYSSLPLEVIETMLPNRNKNSITLKAHSLKIPSFAKLQALWRPEEVRYIIDHWEQKRDKEMACAVNHTEIAVRCKRIELGLLRWDGSHNYEDITKYIRGNIYDWKVRSMESCNYQCVFTGSKDFEIHHLYSVSDILADVIQIHGIQLRDTFESYSKVELKRILAAFIEEQDKHPLGVCLHKDIHKLFHSIYGRGHNTPEQFEIFSATYNFEQYKHVA